MKRLLVVLTLMMAVAPAGAATGNVAAELPAEAREVLAETSNGALIEDATVAAEALTKAEEEQALNQRPESEIPLNLEDKKPVASAESPLLRFLAGFAVLGILAAGAYVWVRRYSKPGPRQNAPQIKVLTQHWLGPKKSLAIVRVAGESILVGITDHNISMLKSLSLLDEDIPVETPERFDRVLATEESEAVQVEEGEDFMITGLAQVKDSVSKRLKNMRSFQ